MLPASATEKEGYESSLATLRRVPDRIMLAVAARDLTLWNAESCVCGWVLREKLAEMRNVAASAVHFKDAAGDWDYEHMVPEFPEKENQALETLGHQSLGVQNEEISWHPVVQGCQQAFGGTLREWEDIFLGVANQVQVQAIERAFVDRLDEAVG